jgi:hypothetical protein
MSRFCTAAMATLLVALLSGCTTGRETDPQRPGSRLILDPITSAFSTRRTLKASTASTRSRPFAAAFSSKARASSATEKMPTPSSRSALARYPSTSRRRWSASPVSIFPSPWPAISARRRSRSTSQRSRSASRNSPRRPMTPRTGASWMNPLRRSAARRSSGRSPWWFPGSRTTFTPKRLHHGPRGPEASPSNPRARDG